MTAGDDWAATLHQAVAALGDTAVSTALRESVYLYAALQGAHVLGIMLFVGTIFMVDLRLLGRAFTSTPVSEMTRRILPWTVAGFVLMAVTGLLLFYALPVRTYHSVWFRLKLLLIVAAAVNIWHFHRRVQRDRAVWDNAARPPLAARRAALASLLLWACVLVAGRLIAYHWADCDRTIPAWVAWVAQCESAAP